MTSSDKLTLLRQWLDMRFARGDRGISAEASETAREVLGMTEEEYEDALDELSRE